MGGSDPPNASGPLRSPASPADVLDGGAPAHDATGEGGGKGKGEGEARWHRTDEEAEEEEARAAGQDRSRPLSPS